MRVRTTSIKEKIFNMYDEEKVGCQVNEYCKFCKKNYKELAGPISFFHIGSNFENDRYKIVFVGKNSWYDVDGFKRDKVKGKCYANATKNGRDSIMRENNRHSNYWGYMRDIIKELYGNVEKGMENIACTNIIKCNTNGEKNVYSDRTPNDIKDNCIASGIFEKEIEIMSPKHVIFLTGEKYDKYIMEKS